MLKRTLPILISIWAVWVQCSLPAVADEVSQDIPGMSWGMMPGESLVQLAELIYPHSPEMQRRFAEASLALNRSAMPDLDPATPFSELTVLQIPDLKALARMAPSDAVSPPRLQLTTQRQPAANLAAVPVQPEPSGIALQLTLEIETLEKRNQALIQQQAMMSERLDLLEGNLRSMQALVSEHRPRKPRRTLPARTVKHDPPASQSGFAFPGPSALAGLAAIVLGGCGWWLYRRRRGGIAVVAKLIPSSQSPVGPAGLTSNSLSVADPGAGATQGGGLSLKNPVTESLAGDHLNVSMHVDEIESIVEEARVYVALGRSEQAVEMLNDYIEAHPRVSVNPWLYLLDLHRAAGRKPEFSALAKRMHQTFNVMAPSWEAASVAMVVPTTLEEFPHILSKLTESWGSQDCHDYLNSLIQDNRDGERAGFSLEVLEEILLLLAVLDMREITH